MNDEDLKKLKIFGENVRRIRLEKGITVKELSEKTEISEKYLNKIENGTAKRISVSHIFIIAEGLNVLPHMLCENL